MSESVTGVYAQLFSVGVLWMSVHCAGMCGPIINGLPLSQERRPLPDALGVLKYQSGRAVGYALLGSIAGLVGAGFQKAFEPAGGVIALVLGAVLLASLVPLGRRESTLVQLTRPPRGLMRRVGSMPAAGVGAVMALMPCMIPIWVLGLAAITGSPVHGALLMLSVVLLTTPILVIARTGGGLLARRLPAWTPAALRLVSAGWLVLVGAATFGWVQHRHWMFHLGEREMVVMFF